MKRIVVVLLIALSWVSCIKDISLDAGERAVVVYCILNDTSVQELRLYYTGGTSRQEEFPVNETVITLMDKTESSEIGRFEYSGDDRWTLDYAAIPGHEYQLIVLLPDHDPIFAIQTMPSLELKTFSDNFSYNDPVDGWQYQEGVSYSLKSSDAVWVCGVNYYLEGARYTMVEEICTGYHPTVDYFNLLGSVYVPKEIYSEKKKCNTYLYPMLEGASLHKRYIRITRPSLSHKYFFSGNYSGGRKYFNSNDAISGGYGHIYTNSPDIEGYVVFTAVSDDYDQYLKQMTIYLEQLQSTDLSSIYQREDFYTNIVGGVGIFGAVVQKSSIWHRAYSSGKNPDPLK